MYTVIVPPSINQQNVDSLWSDQTGDYVTTSIFKIFQRLLELFHILVVC